MKKMMRLTIEARDDDFAQVIPLVQYDIELSAPDDTDQALLARKMQEVEQKILDDLIHTTWEEISKNGTE